MEPVIVDGFTVVQTRFDDSSVEGQCMYLKEHSIQRTDSCKPRDRTLLVLNVPPYCDKACLERVFSPCGKVLRVYLHDTPNAGAPVEENTAYFKKVKSATGYKVGYVVFKSPAGVEKAKALPYDHPLVLSTPEAPVLTGMQKWYVEYQHQVVSVPALQEEVNTWLEEYDKKQEEEIAQAKAMDGVPDEEGWVTVSRHSRNKAIPRTEAHEQRTLANEKRKRSQRELLNFYSFQMRESKKENIAQLRQKFDEDKQRIALMKQARKFKPY